MLGEWSLSNDAKRRRTAPAGERGGVAVAAVTAADVVLQAVAEADCDIKRRVAILVAEMLKHIAKGPQALADGLHAPTRLYVVHKLPSLRERDFISLFVETAISPSQQVDISQLGDQVVPTAFDGTVIISTPCSRARTLVH